MQGISRMPGDDQARQRTEHDLDTSFRTLFSSLCLNGELLYIML
ncbi:hypothetical protein HanXRQr2_Chr16g0747361 [Helianthus annuus]|uniref:Uncharacterized protein n=1 Tax=Helianthus annuus TaxID=4232 RepID=A0A9K3DQR2_HELAN|nr:hypothetical protein HanXRQr2_Chr16g0747361 [Helianthus annuus]KAJ0821135.1 hypothetical protein HanPSC8_Chr16g0716471 [Helianthus annuus]